LAQQAVAAAPDIRLEPVDMALPKHIPALDGLRGIAILLVVLHHLAKSIQLEFTPAHPVMTWVLNAFVLGWSGVDLFFVLSGFLITGILVDAKG
jgi:peptidoglycan/LPS O-acetylase OafA/YrhL